MTFGVFCIGICFEVVEKILIQYYTLVIVNSQRSKRLAGQALGERGTFKEGIPKRLKYVQVSFYFVPKQKNRMHLSACRRICTISVVAHIISFGFLAINRMANIYLNLWQLGELLLAIVDLEREVFAGDVLISDVHALIMPREKANTTDKCRQKPTKRRASKSRHI